ncbi:uncharacterized protein LOC131932598 isoform X2 [Physella acuta]|uniref:uncharacterized protein LOC131932598 isoform X2 n=1 Tax=Physella acuta TaxID=109671 RepID=UPI0027DCC0ED|nr:uncharacterized protein LOC131932598 isoform X2 [Physella acuta]
MAEARRLLTVVDNNMFANALIMSTLLEAFKYGNAPKLSDDQLALSVNFFEDFQDQNAAYNTSLMSFFTQYYDETVNYWHTGEENQVSLLQILKLIPMKFVEALLNGLAPDNLLKVLYTTLGEKALFQLTQYIPTDFDDTFVYMGVGSLLFEMRDQLKTGWELWSEDNTNITSVFDALKKYAYRPFSSDPNVNTIDPRSYFHMRKFLDQAQSEGSDIALVSTWTESIEEQRTLFYKGVIMPYLVNTVDVTVGADTIYGMTSLVLSGVVSQMF